MHSSTEIQDQTKQKQNAKPQAGADENALSFNMLCHTAELQRPNISFTFPTQKGGTCNTSLQSLLVNSFKYLNYYVILQERAGLDQKQQ